MEHTLKNLMHSFIVYFAILNHADRHAYQVANTLL